MADVDKLNQLMRAPERESVSDFAERAYLDYSMYVILDRALPFLGDGLKPVQRRIIYAMSELGLHSGAKYKKSARTVGDVLGKFHPHGDSACYEAMVLMAQPFSYRYPFVDGQGNWGNVDDPKSFAAMRYTESRLSSYADLLLGEVDEGTVEWVDNFDGTIKEPKFLPAKVPNILLNGASGIAVGMATDILPHNLREVISALIFLLDKPRATIAEIVALIPAPDFPTGGSIVSSPEDLLTTYERGYGSVRMRATYTVESGVIVIDALPYQVSSGRIMVQIANQIRAKKLTWLEDIRDESDHENMTRIVLFPSSRNVDKQSLMLHLFATTDLEKNYRVNINVLGLDGKPQVKPLLVLLGEWLQYRLGVVTDKLQHRLNKTEERLHLVEGLMVAYLNLDAVIEIIRRSDKPKDELMSQFGLSSLQADAILNVRLRHLAKLEEVKLAGEQKELIKIHKQLTLLLSSERRIKTFVKKELLSIAETYGDKRRSLVVSDAGFSQALSKSDLAVVENVMVVISEKGWVRVAKGHNVDPGGLSYRVGDDYLTHVCGRSNQQTIFMTSDGRVYSLVANVFPGARGQGAPLTGWFSVTSETRFVDMAIGNSGDYLLFLSSTGEGFIGPFEDAISRQKLGKRKLLVSGGVEALALLRFSKAELDTHLLALATSEGRLLIFPLLQVPVMNKGKGVRLVRLNRQAGEVATVSGLAILAPNEVLKVVSGKRYLLFKPSDFEPLVNQRAARGTLLPKGFQRVERLLCVS